MVLQYVCQAYACAYVSQREWMGEFMQEIWYPSFIAAALWVLCIVLVSATGPKLRGHPCLYIPLCLVFMMAQIALAVVFGIKLIRFKTVMLASIMQLVCYVALALYSCCVKEELSTRYSHLFFGIILAIALGASIAFDCAHWFDHVISGPVVALWTSFVMHNLMAIAKTLQETEGIYAMLKIQADVTVLIRAHC